MRTVGSRELKNRLGQYLRMVVKGETFVVTDRGKHIARLSPASQEENEHENLEAILKRLEAEGHLRRPKAPGRFRKFKPVKVRGKPLSRMIIEDRE